MKIIGYKLAWAMIYFSLFLSFIYSVEYPINFTSPTISDFLTFLVALGLFLFFGWRFIKNMEDAFQ